MRRASLQLAVPLRRHLSSSGEEHIVSSAFGPIDLPECTIPQLAFDNLNIWGEYDAIECGITGEKYTYSKLRQRCRDMAAGLLAGPVKLKGGDVISLVLPNSPDFAVATLGALEAGLVVSPINPVYGPNEIKHQLVDSGSKLVITHELKEADVRAASKDLGTTVITTKGGSAPHIDDVINAGKGRDVPPPVDPYSLAILPYSSGTTGLPKGVRLSHHNIVSNVLQFTHPRIRIMQPTTVDHQDITPCVLPFFHIYGFTVGLLSYLKGGAKIITLPKFDPKLFSATLKEKKANVIHVVPPIMQFMANSPMVTAETIDSLRGLTNGAAPIVPADAERLLQKKNMILISGYGLTESSPALCSGESNEADIRSVGYVVSNTIMKIADVDTGEPQDPSVSGEICCKGPQIMLGYHNNEEATNSTLKDGWLHTGDIGYVDKNDGKLYIVDRMKELIKVKGFQVAPAELEGLVKMLSDVADVGVVGKPDDRSGELPVAFIVPAPGKKITQKDIIEHVAGQVSAPYKRIAEVKIVEAIPRNPSGKILRRELKKML